MPIDVHVHVWLENSFTSDFMNQARRMRKDGVVNLTTDPSVYWKHAPSQTRAIVFGGKARLSGLWVDDRDVANLVASDPRYIGFLSVDPTQPGWEEDLRFSHQELGLRGIKLLPMYAGFAPNDPAISSLYSYAHRHHLPILFHTGTTFISQAPIAHTLPRHLDEVAIKWPEIPMILAHLGHPYEGECIAVVRKHPNLYADISALVYRKWQLLHSLMLVHEYGVWNKVLFGTDFPVTTVNETMASLRELAEIQIGPFQLPSDEIEKLIERDPLPQLGLKS